MILNNLDGKAHSGAEKVRLLEPSAQI